ncbi:MAG: DUF1934 family protein [Anaeroplasmataceae bacterium]
MKIKFYSITEGQTVKFNTETIQEIEGIYIFKDESLENTTLHIEKLNNNKLLFKRYGDTNMEVIYSKNEKTNGIYNNSMGLEFEFYVYTNDMYIMNEKIFVDYDLYLDNIFQGNFKIYVLIN